MDIRQSMLDNFRVDGLTTKALFDHKTPNFGTKRYLLR